MNRLTRRRFLSIVVSFIAMISTSWLVPIAQSAEAPQIAATLQSSTECPAAPKWHMAMLEFFENSTGGTLPRGETVDNYRNLGMKAFLDGLATETGCALWADVDIYDMGDEIYPSNSFPSSIHKAFISKGYDVVMYRYPDFGERESFVGMASPERWIVFPVAGRDLIYGAPWISVIWHEWLHQVEFVALRKKLELGLPTDEVHYRYSANPYYLNIGQTLSWYESAMTFYKDLTAGRVPVEGNKYGFTKNDFSWIGTPSNPKHNIPQVYIYPQGNLIAGSAIVSFSMDSTEKFSITADSESKKFKVQAENESKVKTLSFPLSQPGTRKICFQTSASIDDIWDSSEHCKDITFTDYTPSLYAETYLNDAPSSINPTKVIWSDKYKKAITDLSPRVQIIIRQSGKEEVFLHEYVDPMVSSWQLPTLPIGDYNLCLQLEGNTRECYLLDFEIAKKLPGNMRGIPDWAAIGDSLFVSTENRETFKFENLSPEICSSKLFDSYASISVKKKGNCKFRVSSLGDATYLPLDKVFSIPVIQKSKIKCQKGKTLIYVTGFLPTCPKGFKKV